MIPPEQDVGHAQNRLMGATGELQAKKPVENSYFTLKNALGSAKALHNWLMIGPRFERRPVNEIPPAELDVYLTEFFATVRKADGTDYLPLSFQALRTAIGHFLSMKGYTHAISTSSLFRGSQAAYQARKRHLRAVAASSKKN